MGTIIIKNLSTVKDGVVVRVIGRLLAGDRASASEDARRLGVKMRIKKECFEERYVFTVTDRE